MRSNKGISFQIILMIVAIAAGAVGLMIVSTVSSEAVKSGNYGCLIGNSFKNMLGDIQYDSGEGYCKTDLVTIRAPDFSSATMFKECKPVMIDDNNFIASAEYANKDPDNFIAQCIAYQVMAEAEECWANYLVGEAQFDGTCDRICFADGFSSYSMNERSGTIILPKITGSTINFFPGDFNSNRLSSQFIQNLISIEDANNNYNIELSNEDLGDKIKIDYMKPLGSVSKYSIVHRIPSEVNTHYLSYAIDVIESDPERTGLEGAGFAIESSDQTLESGEEWEIKYYEADNINALTIGGTIIGARIGGVKGATTGATAGFIADTYFGTALEIDGAAVSLNKRGSC